MPGNMATPEGAGSIGHETSFQITIAAEGGELQQRMKRESAAATLETRLNAFVRFVALVEWVGNAFGALAFLWATGVLLGGFCTSLQATDFWFSTVLIFIEAFRIYSRHYRMDNQSLFGTTKALKGINSSFSRMLWRAQEGDKVVLFMGLVINIFEELWNSKLQDIPEVAFLVVMSRWPRWRWGRVTWLIIIIYLGIAAYRFSNWATIITTGISVARIHAIMAGFNTFKDISAILAVLLLKLRPRRIVSLTSSRCGRKLISFFKLILVLWLAFDLVLDIMEPNYNESIPLTVQYNCLILLTEMLLFLGSLQAPTNSDTFGRWIDAILRTSFLSDLIFPLEVVSNILMSMTNLSRPVISGISIFTMVVLMLIGNLQIPAAVAEVLLSSMRIHTLIAQHYNYPLPKDIRDSLVPALEVFYVLALCQGSLYIMASILGIFSFFLRRALVRHSKLGGRQGAKAIDLYYHHAYMKCMDSGLLGARTTMSLASFAMDSLCSRGSNERQLAGLLLLDNLLSQETYSSEKLKTRIISSNKALSMLIGMLDWSGVRDRDTRQLAARVTTKLASSIRIARIPGMVKLVSSLLDDGNQNQPVRQQASPLNHEQVNTEEITSVPLINGESIMANQPPGEEPSAQATSSGTGGCSWVHEWMKRWSILEEPFLTCQDSLPMLGMVILEKLAWDLDNCAEMLKASDFIPRIIRFISYTGVEESNSYDQRNTVLCLSSLHLVRRLASTSGKIGATARQKLWESPFLHYNLAGIFEDSHNSPEVWTLAMDIIAKLALDEDARKDIGSNQVIIGKIVHVFLGRDGPNDQSLRMAAGETLVNLSVESADNCSVILEESEQCELIKVLKDMLREAEYRIYKFVAASLLQNLCVCSRDKLISHPGASGHLKSVLLTVMENIIPAQGKQLETLIGLAAQICSIPECFVFEFESRTIEVSALVKKLVDTLNLNRKPSPEYPRMRRVIVEMVISLVTLYPGYRTMLRDGGMMEALSKAARTPSKVEKYRVFSDDDGLVVESGKPLRDLVDGAIGLADWYRNSNFGTQLGNLS